MVDYPRSITPVNHVEPVPRRIRAFLADELVVDTTRARYVWEWAGYPQYYLPLDDVRTDLLVDEGTVEETDRGRVRLHELRVKDVRRPGAARVLDTSTVAGLDHTVRFDWRALDAWYEESERVYVHPRDPYSRVDAVRSSRHVTVELDGVMLADTHSPVMVFETGLPPRYYIEPPDVRFEHLEPTETRTECPYKGVTSAYWSVRVGAARYPDLAWSYGFPTAALLAIAGLVAFFNEKVDITIDGERLERPKTHFS
jgi:uncharacterized protein (DUF427 family)